jgi:hypothetical protein
LTPCYGSNRASGMTGMGRKADGRLLGPHSEKPAIERACQMHRIFASADT